MLYLNVPSFSRSAWNTISKRNAFTSSWEFLAVSSCRISQELFENSNATEMEIRICIMHLLITCIPSFGIAAFKREIDHFRKVSATFWNFMISKKKKNVQSWTARWERLVAKQHSPKIYSIFTPLWHGVICYIYYRLYRIFR